MKPVLILINKPKIHMWKIVNQIIIEKSNRSIFYHPDILNKHPFEETRLILSSAESAENRNLITLIENLFAKIPPHLITIFLTGDNSNQWELFKTYRDLIEPTDDTFFTKTEEQIQVKLAGILKMTQNQRIKFNKFCIQYVLKGKLKKQQPMVEILLPYFSVDFHTKQERNNLCNVLFEKLTQ